MLQEVVSILGCTLESPGELPEKYLLFSTFKRSHLNSLVWGSALEILSFSVILHITKVNH